MRYLRKRVLVASLSVILLCAMGTTAQAGVVPWVWNFFFGPPNAPLFAGRRLPARYCPPPAPAYAFAPPPVSWAPAPAYTPMAYSTPTVGYAPTVSYAPMTGCGTCTDGCGSTITSAAPLVASPFEYSGYITNSNCCGTVGGVVGSQIIDGSVINGTITNDVVVDPATPEYERDREDRSRRDSDPPVVDPPVEPSRPAAGTGLGDDDVDFRTPINRSPGSAPAADPLDSDIDFDALGRETNKPVTDPAEAGSGAPEAPSSTGPSAQLRRTVISTVSLDGSVGTDSQLRRTFTSARANKARRSFRWISVPGDGRKARL
ncbi:MAG: hypothetical protein AB8G99_22470 [Planctomycetaceae bacterium]